MSIAIEHVLENKELFRQACTHDSYAKGVLNDKFKGNERLEFLGDAVLAVVVSKRLYDEFPDREEGELSKMRSNAVKGKTLAKLALKIGLPKHLLLTNGEIKTGGANKESILASSFEALIGAIFIEKGLDGVIKFVNDCYGEDFYVFASAEKDPKTELQEKLQALGRNKIEYKTIKAEGPDHKKRFTVAVYCGNEKLGTGEGDSKKKAEMAAAQKALTNIKHSN